MLNSKYAIDYANIGLILLSFLLAFIIPFELFLFSYAVLGPLHYLTEIGWLHQRNYFTKGKYDFLILVVFGLLLFASQFNLIPALAPVSNKLIVISFLAALIMVLVKDNTIKFSLLAVAAVCVVFISNKSTFVYMFFGVFLPTLIHVFLFTAAFMLFGAMKARSKPGIISVVLLFTCAILLFVINPNQTYAISDDIRAKWFGEVDGSFWGFVNLNYTVLDFFNQGNVAGSTQLERIENMVFHSQSGILLARFVAFAYTYHYLNWFSKTSVIKWHKVPVPFLVGTGIIWAAAVGIYWYDYGMGLQFLFLLSFLHVLLEFPLNFQSFIGIGKEFGGMISGKAAKA